MNRIIVVIFSMMFLLSCVEDESPQLQKTNVILSFSHNWNGVNVNNLSFNTVQYINENNDVLSIERLRYLISNITFQKTNGEKIVIKGYNLIDLADSESFFYQTPIKIPIGVYSNVFFTFGFNNQDNLDGIYTDLNTASWNVPMMLGGGYHYMQLDGKFVGISGIEQGFQYHAIRAVDKTNPENLVFQDTFFNVNLGEVVVRSNSNINVKMNIAEWFKEPYLWDLNQLNSMLMSNFEAQIKMYDNGQNVFSLGSVN